MRGLLIVYICLAACSDPEPLCAEWQGPKPALGGAIDQSQCWVHLATFSANATRVEAWFYDDNEVVYSREMARSGDVWSIDVPLDVANGGQIQDFVLYGYRAWGPNWPYEESWEPGTSIGSREDVDADGNRFNPNKLLIDPYAREITHDPATPHWFATGSDWRHIDTGPTAPKSIAFAEREPTLFNRPTHLGKDDIIYEVHVRGLTKNDDTIPSELRGTYAGAAQKAPQLAELGINAIEFLPIHETRNDYNDDEAGTNGDNYWGYSSLSFFAPDRRYAVDRSPGGPTREFREMVQAFHQQGIKVYLDVVYNHTAEGPPWDAEGRIVNLLSWRGLDAATYYQQDASGRLFRNDNGVGPNLATANEPVATMVLDSLRYWTNDMGVDGYRFDLAPILGNTCEDACFTFDNQSLLTEIQAQVDARMIAEPWTTTSYQLGQFPPGWSEWNDNYRDTTRRDLNRNGIDEVTPRQLMQRLGGSPDVFSARKPWHSVNFVTAHDGFTLVDLFSCNEKSNQQDWPYGPSDGGSDNNLSWDHQADPLAQRQAARTAMALVLLSAGTPMFTGGDEFLRTQYCNNNPYNLDSIANWLDWQAALESPQNEFKLFTAAVIALRRQHDALRPELFPTGDLDSDGRPDLTWRTPNAQQADDAYLDDAANQFIAMELDATPNDSVSAIYVGYNGGPDMLDITLPPGLSWQLSVDTASWRESSGNAGLAEPLGATYTMHGRSVVVAVGTSS